MNLKFIISYLLKRKELTLWLPALAVALLEIVYPTIIPALVEALRQGGHLVGVLP